MIETDVVTGAALKLTCPRDELIRQLAIVSRAASTRTTVQVLAGVLLRTDEGKLQLAATDMELSLRTSLEADVDTEHRQGEGVVEIVSGSASYHIHTYNAEDFPRLPELSGTELATIDAEALLATATKVGRAASRDESRPVLTGILVRFEGENLIMAATDSYRLAVKETSMSTPAPELDAIVPARALLELARVAQGASELQLGVQENQVLFASDGVLLTTRRIEGQFPNYRQLLPESFEHEVTLPREELLDVVRRVAVMAQRNAPLRLRFAEGELTVSAQTQDVGEGRETMPASYNGDALDIGFNPEFLRDGIESAEGDELRLKLISPLRPAVLQGAAEDFSYLIMPIRLAG